MATRALRIRTTSVYPNAKFPDEVDPSDRPTIYASIAKGGCLRPVFEDGECIAFSKEADIAPGDYVGVTFMPEAVRAGELPNQVKHLRSMMPGMTFPYKPTGGDLMPLVDLEQHNPPRIFPVRADHILAMHKVIGTAVSEAGGMARLVPLTPERLDRLQYVLVRCA